MGKIYVGQEATLRADTFQDLSAATAMQLSIKKPDGILITKVANSVAGQPTKIEWTATPADLDLPGEYRIQAGISFGGAIQPGETYILKVYANFS